MDRDYDELHSQMILDRRVIYTWGYSYENDIFCRQQLKKLFFDICAVCPSTNDVYNLIDDWFSQFIKDVRWPHIADAYVVKARKRGLERERSKRYLKSNAYDADPAFDRDKLHAEVARFLKERSERYCGLTRNEFFNERQCIGHILSSFAFRILTRLHSMYSKLSKLTDHGVRSAAISAFHMTLLSEPNNTQTKYYRNALG